mgnify:CR=1 FL=1
MAKFTYDIVGIGNAIVDVIAPCSDAFIDEFEMSRGGMRLIDRQQAETLLARMPKGHETPGGSAANTLAGLAQLNLKCAFIAQVANDRLGQVFAKGMTSMGIHFETPMVESGEGTGRCLICVTPDGERTMNTFLGDGQSLCASAISEELIVSSAILYLEGYLWDPLEPRKAMQHAINIAQKSGTKVAFTASETFIIEQHREDFRDMLNKNLFDILFLNDHELASLTECSDFEEGVDLLSTKVPSLVVTRGKDGAMAVVHGERVDVSAVPVSQVVDTTGAGDQFAAGFLAGYAKGAPPLRCLKQGAIAAAEVISHFGPRSEV